jgi:hypothetical protein
MDGREVSQQTMCGKLTWVEDVGRKIERKGDLPSKHDIEFVSSTVIECPGRWEIHCSSNSIWQLLPIFYLNSLRPVASRCFCDSLSS